MSAEILDRITEALELDETIALETDIDEVGEWDSIGWLNIMSMLDEQYGVQLNVQAIRSMRQVGDLVEYVVSRTGDKADRRKT